MSNHHSSVFWSGILLGSAAGTLAGLLIAPRPGKETRRVLKKSVDALPELSEDLSTTLQLHAEHLSEAALQNWQETLSHLKVAIAAGIEASHLETIPEPTKEKPTNPSSDKAS